MEFIQNGGSIINNLIRKTKEEGRSSLTITGYYELEETIILPSNFRLVLEDCHLKLAEGTFCNLFRNEHAFDKIPDENITIEGKGFAILDGGVYNGFGERNLQKDSSFPLYLNNLIFFANIDGFKICGIRLQNQRWFAINMLSCTKGLIRDIEFQADDISICPDGSLRKGVTHDGGSGYRITNADGLNVRAGCHDILIENITGFTEDDTIALSAFGETNNMPTVIADGRTRDVYNIIIRNVRACTLCALIRVFVYYPDMRVHDVLIDGVFDVAKDSPSIDFGHHGVRIDNYCTTKPTDNYGIENFTVKNVYTATRYAIRLSGYMRNMQIERIVPLADYTIPLVHRASGENINFYSAYEMTPHRFPKNTNLKEDDTVKLYNAVGYYVVRKRADGEEDMNETLRQKSEIDKFCIEKGINICAWFYDNEGSTEQFEELVNNPALLKGYSGIVLMNSRDITNHFTKYFNMETALYHRGVEIVPVWCDIGKDN